MKRLTKSDLIFLTRRLAFLMEASISLSQAFSIITNQSTKRLKPHLQIIENEIKTGLPLSSILKKYPTYYSPFIVHLIAAGEKSGQLKECLQHISNELERQKMLTKRIISLSVYPCMIALSTILLSLFLLFFIFPKIRTLFQSMHTTLPYSTRFVIWLTDFVSHYGLIFFISIFIVITFGIYCLKKYPEMKIKKDTLLLHIPILKTFIIFSQASLFFRTMGIMLGAHIPIDTSLSIASSSLSHNSFKTATEAISIHVHNHGAITEIIKKYPKLFHETSVQLIEVGEQSGTLAQSLIFLSTMYDQELEDKIKLSMNFLEPGLMAVMGLIVGFISLSIITPLYAITQNISH